MNITEKIDQLKLNVKQHQAQIQILTKEIKQLEAFKSINSNDNVISVDNDNIPNDNDNSNVDMFCNSNVKKTIISKNENLKEFI